MSAKTTISNEDIKSTFSIKVNDKKHCHENTCLSLINSCRILKIRGYAKTNKAGIIELMNKALTPLPNPLKGNTTMISNCREESCSISTPMPETEELKDTEELKIIIKNFRDNLNKDLKLQISEWSFEIMKSTPSDGKGFSTGGQIEKILHPIFTEILPEYEEYHVGEADFKINGFPLSFKTIYGVSDIGLAWSKNPESSKKREFFNENIMIFNRKGGQGWKQGPVKPINGHDKE